MKKYIVDYENWHFESYWNEMLDRWSVYQVEKVGKTLKLRRHSINEKPVATEEDAIERVENWEKLKGVNKNE